MLAFRDPEIINVEHYLGTLHSPQEEVSQLAREGCHHAVLQCPFPCGLRFPGHTALHLLHGVGPDLSLHDLYVLGPPK